MTWEEYDKWLEESLDTFEDRVNQRYDLFEMRVNFAYGMHELKVHLRTMKRKLESRGL